MKSILFEYRSSGPGAVQSPARRQLTDAEAAAYRPSLVLDGWIPPIPALQVGAAKARLHPSGTALTFEFDKVRVSTKVSKAGRP